MVMIGVFHPIVSVSFMAVGMIVSIWAGIFQISFGILMGMIVITIITLYRLNRA